MTAYGDAKILGDAINDGNIYRYVAKPWEPDDMRLTVQRAIEAYALEAERATLLERADDPEPALAHDSSRHRPAASCTTPCSDGATR